MVIGYFDMVFAIFIFILISFCLIGMCYSLHITFCRNSCGSSLCCNTGQNSSTDDSIATLDVLYILSHSKGSTDDTSMENSSKNDDDYDTEHENKKKDSRIFFLSKKEKNYVEG